MQRVLLLCEYATLNGGEQSMLATLDGVGKAGIEPIVAAPVRGPLADALGQMGIDVVPLESHDAGGKRFPLPRLREEIAERIGRLCPDLVHANSLSMGRVSGPVVAAAAVPSLTHLRDIIKLSDQAIADLNCHTHRLAVSQATRDFHVSRGLRAETTHVLYNGVDLGRFRPRSPTGYLHRELGIANDVPLLGTIGQIGLRKGQDLLVRAAELLPRSLQAAMLTVGQRFSDKDESREFEANLHRTAGPTGRFHFLGWRDDMQPFLNELTLLVHPARQEPLGRVLLEAAASGVPVIAFDVGGTREIFPGPSHARIVVPGSAEALAAAIEELLVDSSARAQMAVAARQRIEEAFDHRRATAALVERYRATMQSD